MWRPWSGRARRARPWTRRRRGARRAREALERGLEAEAEVGERRRLRPRRRGGGATTARRGRGGGSRRRRRRAGLRPLREEAAEEGGLADAAGPVEDERLRDARAERVVVEDRLEDGARDTRHALRRPALRRTRRPWAAAAAGGW